LGVQGCTGNLIWHCKTLQPLRYNGCYSQRHRLQHFLDEAFLCSLGLYGFLLLTHLVIVRFTSGLRQLLEHALLHILATLPRHPLRPNWPCKPKQVSLRICCPGNTGSLRLLQMRCLHKQILLSTDWGAMVGLGIWCLHKQILLSTDWVAMVGLGIFTCLKPDDHLSLLPSDCQWKVESACASTSFA
jgi:hypothetical protein